MNPIKKKQLFFCLASLFSMATVLLLAFVLYQNRDTVSLNSILWLLGLFLGIILLLAAVVFGYGAWNSGRKKKDIRFS